ncbi:XRE family transcriptional regulator [Mycobacterium sp. URHB0021]|jgi:predicted XRE-type DNA-binding protein
MGFDTKSALDQPRTAVANPKPARDNVVRIDLSDPPTIPAINSITMQAAPDLPTSGEIPTSPSHVDRPHLEPCSPTNLLPSEIDTKEENAATWSARQTLITAVIKRITQQRLTAAQAAVLLHLTGPRVTKLLQARIHEFTLDDLLELLPALELTIQVVPANAGDEAR